MVVLGKAQECGENAANWPLLRPLQEGTTGAFVWDDALLSRADKAPLLLIAQHGNTQHGETKL